MPVLSPTMGGPAGRDGQLGVNSTAAELLAVATIWPLSFDRGRAVELVAGFGRDEVVEVLHRPAST